MSQESGCLPGNPSSRAARGDLCPRVGTPPVPVTGRSALLLSSGAATSRPLKAVAGLLCVLALSVLLPFAVALDARAAQAGLGGATVGAAAGDPSGATIHGDAWSVGPGLATAANQAAAMGQNTLAAQALLSQIASLNAALQAKMGGGTSAGAALTAGAAEEIVKALERLAATLSADLEAAQHNPLNTDDRCADLASALAASGQGRARAGLDRAQEAALDDTRRDATARNFAQAQGQQDVVLLDSDLFRDEKVFRPGWIQPADGRISSPARASYMIGVLSNPVPVPRVAEEAALTPGGRKGASAVKIKSAQTGLAEGALRFVTGFYLPVPGFEQAVPELEEEAGVPEEDRMEKTSGAEGDVPGYSLMQYFAARQQYFSGNVNKLRSSVLWNTSDTLKQIYTLLAEDYHLRLESLRASLFQTSLLATLVGMGSRDQNEVIARHLAPLRQNAPK